jgi:dTMP kinase
LRELQNLAVGETTPDLTFLLDLPVTLGLARRSTGGARNRFDREIVEFHERVAAWYRETASRDVTRWHIIDATAAPDVVHTQVIGIVRSRLGASMAQAGRPPQ